eukprot:TRINITY_DN38170_c0_g1_i1.p1 TRINITY_DN38170_c0_g1~~TRINITY_DN38170_c0_g1_i1.p1  ORF type:complete len:493 (+),score=140.05 TRINITY_DN38170_c0_g1_i1:34-1479(+)
MDLGGSSRYDPRQHITDANEMWDGWSTDGSDSGVPSTEVAAIDLAAGHPPEEDLPVELIQSASQDIAIAALNYGGDAGDAEVLGELACFLNDQYGIDLDSSFNTRGGIGSSFDAIGAEHLLLTGGCSQALDVLCTTLPRAGHLIASEPSSPSNVPEALGTTTATGHLPGRLVFVEKPTYHLALRMFETHLYEVVSVECDGEGMIPSDLEAKFGEHGVPSFIYIIPTGHNPTGRNMSEKRRTEVIEMARARCCYIVADEVYHMLHYGKDGCGAPPSFSKLLQESGAHHVISISSVSKILSPGLRVGWVHASRDVVQSITVLSGLIKSSGSLCQFASHVLKGVLSTGGLTKHLTALRHRYAAKRDAAAAAMEEHLAPLGVTFAAPSAGYFMWCTLPLHLNVADLQRVLNGRVLVAEGGQFVVEAKPAFPSGLGGSAGGSSPHSGARARATVSKNFRLCFIAASDVSFRSGVEQIAAAVQQLLL